MRWWCRPGWRAWARRPWPSRPGTPPPATTRPPGASPVLLGEYLAWRRRFDDWLATTTISLNAARRPGDRYGEGTALGNLGPAALWALPAS